VAARDDAAPRASRSSRVIFFQVGLLRDPRREDCVLQVQRVSKLRRCELGQRSRRSLHRCDCFNSNPPTALGPTTAHMPPAISTRDSVPLDSHLWTDRQNMRGSSRGPSEGQRKFVRMRSRGWTRGAGSLCVMYGLSVCLYMRWCDMSGASIAGVIVMYREAYSHGV